jgi:hypothetical protein
MLSGCDSVPGGSGLGLATRDTVRSTGTQGELFEQFSLTGTGPGPGRACRFGTSGSYPATRARVASY